MNVLHLAQSGASVHHRGPGKHNLASIRACYLADLVLGTAGFWARSPKRIVQNVGAPVSHEYLRLLAQRLTAAERQEVVLGMSSLVEACSSDTTAYAAFTVPTAATRLEQVVSELGVSATLDLLTTTAARVKAA